ncbi:MAG TPA: hypothetical protein IAB38_03925 [Candidatus Onthousia excrementipullorum]|uniref:Uncharacterized protein n=1 Tax=Candidatus Onthousia excrementipullorum TaxID=2840884 RepID=A0A9D1DUJ0_9FIRM|nr:hypothetical protein [Candidatus Onthousia excrementipullorum]
MKNFIKNNKVTVVAFIICVIFVVLVFAIKLTFFPNEGTAIYGDRLDGIEKVEITDKQQKDIIKSLEDKDEVKSADTDIKGRTLNVLITVNDDVELDPAKALTSSVIDNLKKDQTSFYDIQVFISKDNDDTRFPIIGYKHQDKDEFSWTKDR